MYAIIQTGGKQYRVSEGQTLQIEKLPVEVGGQVDFTDVLMVTHGENVHIGLPHVANATVTAEVISEGRGPKINIIKLKRRKHHLKHQGHRQDFTEVKITSIALDGKKLEGAQKAEKPVAKKTTAKKVAAKKPTRKTAEK